MRQNVARKQCTTTPRAIGKTTRPSQVATRYPEGGTSRTKDLLGQGATRKQPRGGGREANTKPQTDNEEPKRKGGGKQKTQRRNRQSRGTQANEKQTAKTHKNGPKQRAKQGTTQRRGKHSHQGVLDRGWIRKRGMQYERFYHLFRGTLCTAAGSNTQ